jgi:hypothetical protein
VELIKSSAHLVLPSMVRCFLTAYEGKSFSSRNCIKETAWFRRGLVYAVEPVTQTTGHIMHAAEHVTQATEHIMQAVVHVTQPTEHNIMQAVEHVTQATEHNIMQAAEHVTQPTEHNIMQAAERTKPVSFLLFLPFVLRFLCPKMYSINQSHLAT